MENPYQSPEASLDVTGVSPFGDPYQRRSRLVGHVRVVAILMIIQGTLESLAVVGLAAMTFFMTVTVQEQDSHTGPESRQFLWMFTVIYGGMVVAALVAAVLHIAAGVQNLRFRGKILGFVALASGLLTLFTCYCLPTAVALGVYGLIVYLNEPVAEAFRMGQAGHTTGDILAALSPIE